MGASLCATVAVIASLATTPARAGDATWLLSPPNEDFNDPVNWGPPPTGAVGVPTGTASLGASSQTTPLIEANTTLNQIEFTSSTPESYTIGVGFVGPATLTLNGPGVTNSSIPAQGIELGSSGRLIFNSGATAGDNTHYTNLGGEIVFNNSIAGSAAFQNEDLGTITFNNGHAGSGEIDNNAGTVTFENGSNADSVKIFSGALGPGEVIFTGASNAGTAEIQILSNNSLDFNDSSTAGSANISNDFSLDFNNNSNAGGATITNNTGGTMDFNDSSTAGSATITNNSVLNFNPSARPEPRPAAPPSSTTTPCHSTPTARPAAPPSPTTITSISTAPARPATPPSHNGDFGTMNFNNNSMAGNATITNNGNVFFESGSTAGNATITNNHNVFFSGNSTGGNAAITNASSGAVVDFSGSTGPAGDHKLTAGSIAGAGSFLLGSNELTVGGNNMSTDVSGDISGILGSLVKVGTGTLTLSGNANLGGTTIDGGTLAVNGGALNAGSTIVVGSTAGSSGTLNIGAERERIEPEISSSVKAGSERSQSKTVGR